MCLLNSPENYFLVVPRGTLEECDGAIGCDGPIGRDEGIGRDAPLLIGLLPRGALLGALGRGIPVLLIIVLLIIGRATMGAGRKLAVAEPF